MQQAGKSAATDYIDHGSETYRFLEDPVVDALVQVVMELGSETWINRRRLFMLESLLAQQGVITATGLETHAPSAEEAALWRTERDRLLRTVYAALARPPGGEQDAAERAKTAAAPRRRPRLSEAAADRGPVTGPSGVV
jgi:hypothetical protein